MMHKKNTLLLLFLTIICSHNPLQCMFGRFSAYATKKLPAITALLKQRVKTTPTVPAGHVISNVDGSEVTECQFNEIKEVLRPNEFPTALQNPNYNPDTDETKIVQKELDEKYKQDMLNKQLLNQSNQTSDLEPKKTAVQWIPDTFYDLFRFSYSHYKDDEYRINNRINDYLAQNPKKEHESDANYYTRIAVPLIDVFTNHTMSQKERIFKGYKAEVLKKTIQDTINIELDQHAKNPTHALLYRGGGSDKDFDKKDAYDVGKNGKNAMCCKTKTQGDSEMLSYGISLLSNSKGGGACPFFYTFYKMFIPNKDPNQPDIQRTEPDLEIISIPKKDFINNQSLWYVNSKYDNHKSFHSYGVKFHPRRKAITTADNLKDKFIERDFKIGDPRIKASQTIDEACADYAKAKEYHINHTIGITPYTRSKIKTAQEAYAKGVADRNNSWASYIYSLYFQPWI